jgi:hypothetical protein
MKKLINVFCLCIGVFGYSQVGIGTPNPNLNSVLEISSTTKGFLPPRLNLTGTKLTSPLSAHVQGMIVYNLATANDVKPGLYQNTGSSWERLVENNAVASIKASVRNVTGTVQNVSGASQTTVLQVDKADVNDGNFDLTTETYTVPKAGYYQVSLQTSMGLTSNGTTSQNMVLYAYFSSGSVVLHGIKTDLSPGQAQLRGGTTTMYCNVGDLIRATVQTCGGTGTQTCAGASYNFNNTTMIITYLPQ